MSNQANSGTSTLSNGLLWFGAAVSIAEIMTGVLLAPLGFSQAVLAIVVGHAIGFVLLYLAGLIGARSKLAAIESSRISFGKYGSYIFSVLNVLQMVGWTAVMILTGAQALNQITKQMFGIDNEVLWSIVIGALIILWVVIGIKNLGKVNVVAVGLLFILTIVLSAVVFGEGGSNPVEGSMTFGAAVELSVAMPLSWLPVIADYTRYAQKPQQATAVSSIVYCIGSCWMYMIGLGAALFAGSSDIAQILMTAGLGITAVIIVVFSTVTTTFLDVFSGGVSVTNITKKISEKSAALVVGIIGTLVAIFTPISKYEDFLYLIGSVFAPMSAILFTDYFIFKKRDIKESVNWLNLILWAVGFAIYRIFISLDTFLGSTLPVMVVISLLCILVHAIAAKLKKG